MEEPTSERIHGLRGRCPDQGKKQFDTEKEAHLEAKKFRKKFGPRLKQYECVYCHYWHNGHDRPPHRRQQRPEYINRKDRPPDKPKAL